jgi:hypothetical protein
VEGAVLAADDGVPHPAPDQNRASKLARSSVPSTRALRNVRSKVLGGVPGHGGDPRVGAPERERLK